jgi:hypothetical protein
MFDSRTSMTELPMNADNVFVDDIEAGFGDSSESKENTNPFDSGNPFEEDVAPQLGKLDSPVAASPVPAVPAAENPDNRAYETYGPDLYGPFWIATTMIFSLAFIGNLVNYANDSSADAWTFSYEKLSLAATMTYLMVSLLPLLAWLLIRHYKVPFRLVEVLCLYGYSFTIYIPATVLCALPVPYLSIAAMCLAFAVSTLFLCRNVFVKFALSQPSDAPTEGAAPVDHRSAGLLVVSCIAVANAGIAIANYFYFLRF